MAILASIASEAKGDAERAVAISDLPEYLYKTERENKVFFVCSLVDYIARKTKNRRSDVVEALGSQRLGRIVELADVYHCDNIDVVSDHFIEEADIGEGVFDNVAAARYAVPSHWDIGKVYKRPCHRRPRGDDRCRSNSARLLLAGQCPHRRLQRQLLLRFARGHLRRLRHGGVGVAIFVTLTWDAIIR